MILDLGQVRLAVPAACEEPWMQGHQSLLPATSLWHHQPTVTKKSGALTIRQDDRVLDVWGRGGRVRLDHRRHQLHTFYDEGFWLPQALRFYDISTRVRAGQLACHTSVIKKNRSLWLLAGRSTAGKTTAADLAAENGWQKIQDDLAYLENGCCLPSIDWNVKSRERLPAAHKVSGIVILEKATHHQLIRVDYLEAIKKLGPIWGSPTFQSTEQWMAVLDRELGQIPVYRLRFRKDAAFLPLLENA